MSVRNRWKLRVRLLLLLMMIGRHGGELMVRVAWRAPVAHGVRHLGLVVVAAVHS